MLTLLFIQLTHLVMCMYICKDTSVSLYVFEHVRIYSYLHTAVLYIYISHSKPLGDVVAVDAFSVKSLHCTPSPTHPQIALAKTPSWLLPRRNQAACMYKKGPKD